MKLSSNLKIGAKYSVSQFDRNGDLKRSSDPGCNLIVDGAATVMQSGYTQRPAPKLGSSILEADVSQQGVMAYRPTMVLTDIIDHEGVTYTHGNNSVRVGWKSTLKFKNEGVSAVDVSEIGYDNLNRMVFKDESGNVTTWSVDPDDVLVIEEDFGITFTAPITPSQLTIVDHNDAVIGNVTVSLNVIEKVENAVGHWWDLLKKPTSAAYLVNDVNWDGVTPPTNANRLIPSNEPSYGYDKRQINVGISHRGRAGGDTIKGIVIQFGTLTPVFVVTFSTPITIGSGYMFEINLTANW